MTAVKICSISILLGLFTSCYDGVVNGRRYKLKNTCVKSHIERGTRLTLVGKLWLQVPSSDEICEKYKTDTIWETK
jgi:hypothetical protein